jgi:hypothetical protein
MGHPAWLGRRPCCRHRHRRWCLDRQGNGTEWRLLIATTCSYSDSPSIAEPGVSARVLAEPKLKGCLVSSLRGNRKYSCRI